MHKAILTKLKTNFYFFGVWSGLNLLCDFACPLGFIDDQSFASRYPLTLLESTENHFVITDMQTTSMGNCSLAS